MDKKGATAGQFDEPDEDKKALDEELDELWEKFRSFLSDDK